MKQGQIVWFEIPVTDFNRAIRFYSEILSIKIEVVHFLEQEYGVFNIHEHAIKGVLVKKSDIFPGKGITLFFYVVNHSESLEAVEKMGGKVISGKTLIKQKNKEGLLTINNNLIDGNIGYYSLITDSEGNTISLYSNS